MSDLFGWGKLSWIFAPFGLIALRRVRKAWTILAVAPSLILSYMFYWIGSWVYGPRYYFEGLVSFTIASAAAVPWLAGRLISSSNRARTLLSRLRFGLVSLVTIGLVAASVLFYSPIRLGGMRGLYGASREQLVPFQTADAQKLAPALVIVHRLSDWREYGTLLELSSPYFDTPFVFTFDRDPEMNQQAIDFLPGRSVYYYYADEPFKFYTMPR